MNKLLKNSSIFGSLAAINSFIFFYFILTIGVYPFSNIHLAELLIFALFIFLGVFQYRTLLQNKKFHFAQGVVAGLFTAAIGVVIYAILMYIFLQFLMPKVLDFHIATMKTNLIADKANLVKMLGKDAFDGTLKGLESTTASSIALDELMKKMFFCFMPSILAAVIARRSDEEIVPLNNPHKK